MKKYIEETEIKRIVHEIETMRVGAMTHPRTPIWFDSGLFGFDEQL